MLDFNKVGLEVLADLHTFLAASVELAAGRRIGR